MMQSNTWQAVLAAGVSASLLMGLAMTMTMATGGGAWAQGNAPAILTPPPPRPPRPQPVPAEPLVVDGVELPAPLGAADVERYREIFRLQEEARWQEADAIIDRLDNDLLMGRVLAQRYMAPEGWRSTYTELRDWLALYNDHPHASRIYRLALKRKPAKARAPKKPKPGYLNGYGASRDHHSSGYYAARIPQYTRGRASPAKTRSIARQIRVKILNGHPTGGLNLLTEANRRYLTKYEEAVLRGDIARGYFIYGKDKEAMEQADAALGLGGGPLAQARWTGGIAAWRAGDIPHAMDFFAPLAADPDAPAQWRSSAAFWAARGALRLGDAAGSFRYLGIAAEYPDTFYGVLATEALGQLATPDFSLPRLQEHYIRWLAGKPGGRRAFALLQVGEVHYASRELRYLWEQMNSSRRTQTMVLAAQTNMAGLAFRSADILRREQGFIYPAALYPVFEFDPEDTLRVDRALLLAVMRQESGFNPRALSSARAGGLMQLMPATAAYIARDRRYRASRRHRLLIPEVNIRLGEDYILYLLENEVVDRHLLRMLAAYNGGPGNLRKWMRQIDHGGDMLMLIESLPSRETRFYVKNVITNLWVYRRRLGEEAHFVAGIASGIENDTIPVSRKTAER